MGKPFSFGRKGWVALGVVGLVIALALTVWVLWPTEAPGVEEAIAQYSHKMENRPSAKTAAAMLDYAIDWGDDKLIFTVLKEHIYPHIGVEGVLTEFERGSRWYFRHSANAEDVFWLEEEIRRLDPNTDLNEDLADFYTRRRKEKQTVEIGHQLLVNWRLNEAARTHYLESLKTLWSRTPLPIQGKDGHQVIEMAGQILQDRSDLPEFKDLPLYLQLWARCYQGELDADFVALLEQTSPEADPLELYWPTWTVALLRDLGPGWHNPLGLDVTKKISDSLGDLSEDLLSEMYASLYPQRDPASPSQATLLLDILSRHGLAKRHGYDAMIRLLNDAEIAPSLPDKPVYTAQDIPVALSSDVQAILGRLADVDFPYSNEMRALRTLSQIQIPDSDLILRKSKSMNLYIRHDITFSSSQPAALMPTDEGLMLVDIVNLTETIFKGQWGSWAPQGDRFALIKSQGGKSTIRIMSTDGQEIKRYTLDLDMPIFQDEDETYVPTVDWCSPWELSISYSDIGLYGLSMLPSNLNELRYKFNLNTQELAKVKPSENWIPYQHLPGTDMFYGPDLVDSSGNIVGEILEISNNCASTPDGDVRLRLVDQELVLETVQGSKTVLSNVSHFSWAALADQEILAISRTTEQFSSISRYIAIDISTGAVRSLTKGKMWYDDADYIIKGSEWQIQVSSDYFQQHGIWHDDEDYYSNTLYVGDTAFPVSLQNAAFMVYKTGDSYILVATGIKNHFIQDVCWILIFN